MSRPNKLTQSCRRFLHRFSEDNVFHLAASLSYSTLLTLVPFLIVMFYILSLVPAFQGMGIKIQHFILSYFVTDLADSINQQLDQFINQMHALRLINIGALLVVTLLMMNTIVNAFDRIWHTRLKYHFALSFLFHLIILILAPLVFAGLLLLGPYLASMHLLTSDKVINVVTFIQGSFMQLLPHLTAFVVFTLFNWLIPSTKVKLRYALLSGFLTMLLFDLAKAGFALYLIHVHTYRMIYGTLATIPLFLFWIYISWVIILSGTLFCCMLNSYKKQ